MTSMIDILSGSKPAGVRGHLRYRRRTVTHRVVVFREKHPWRVHAVFSVFMSLIPVIIAAVLWATISWYSLQPKAELDYDTKQLVFSQVTVVSLTMSIVALTSGFSTRRIYGFRLSEAVYTKPFFNFITIFSPILMTLINLGLLFTKQDGITIFKIYCCSFVLVIFQIARAAMPIIAPMQIDKSVRMKYYRACVHQMRKDRPLFPSTSREMTMLRDVTFRHIESGDVQMFDNIEMELNLESQLMCARKRDYQNYLIEFSNFNDPMTHVSQYARELLFRGKYLQGVRYIRIIYRHLNYYGIVNFSNHELYPTLDQAAESAKYLPDERIASEYQKELIGIVMELSAQEDLYLRTDFGGYRLFDAEVDDPPCLPHGLLANYYQALMNNKGLDSGEKTRLLGELLDDIGMYEFYQAIRRRTWEDYSGPDWQGVKHLHREPLNYCLPMKPLAILVISLMEAGDDQAIHAISKIRLPCTYFTSLWAQCLLSLVWYVSSGCERTYVMGLAFKEADAIRCLRLVPLDHMLEDEDSLRRAYYEMRLCLDGGKASCKEAGAYGFDPKLYYGRDPKPLLNATFLYLLERGGLDASIVKGDVSGPATMILREVFDSDG